MNKLKKLSVTTVLHEWDGEAQKEIRVFLTPEAAYEYAANLIKNEVDEDSEIMACIERGKFQEAVELYAAEFNFDIDHDTFLVETHNLEKT